MRYILHYTNPGDIVFDGFCGTGMTGVAAQLCGDREEVLALDYQIQADGTILQQEEDENGKQVWKPFSKLGARKAVLNDLSPAATFIAYNYNTRVDVSEFEKEAKRILKEVEDECGWMYETLHTDGKTKGKINYTVWSDVFVCPECASDIVFWDVAVDKELEKVKDSFICLTCAANLDKSKLLRAWKTANSRFKISSSSPIGKPSMFLNSGSLSFSRSSSVKYSRRASSLSKVMPKQVTGPLAWVWFGCSGVFKSSCGWLMVFPLRYSD